MEVPWNDNDKGCIEESARMNLDELVSKTWNLDQINEAIADTKLGSAKRNVIVFETQQVP